MVCRHFQEHAVTCKPIDIKAKENNAIVQLLDMIRYPSVNCVCLCGHNDERQMIRQAKRGLFMGGFGGLRGQENLVRHFLGGKTAYRATRGRLLTPNIGTASLPMIARGTRQPRSRSAEEAP